MFEVEDIINRIESIFPIQASVEPKEISLKIQGIDEKLHLAINDEITIYTDNWHEHIATVDELIRFLDGLLSGNVKVVVKYRGTVPVGQRIIGPGKARSRTWNLFSPFWRPKKYKELNYVPANRGVKRDAACADAIDP
jgi:hypothetical protein